MSKSRAPYQLQPLSILTVLLELGIIIACGFYFSRGVQDWRPNVMFGGPDYPSAMHQSSFVWAVFHKTGAIPLWDPFIGYGEPMFENLASSALNPLLMVPVLIFGPVQGGKVALFFHIFLMGVGGWLLARVLRLNWPGRIMLGLLITGSGSIVAQFGDGFIHLAFPQVYIPYAFAGLIGTLYLRRRWPIVMLAVASALMPYSGGEWYVLPTAIMATLLSGFAILNWEPTQKTWNIDWRMVRRLVGATVLTVGLVAIRFLSLHRELVFHPANWAGPSAEFLDMLKTYFVPYTPRPDYGDLWINYHYVVPMAFAIFLLVLRTVLYRPSGINRVGVWRIIVPALILILILTIWAMGDTPFVEWLYQTIPFLVDWKNSGRIAAGASIWVIALVAIWFDDVVFILLQMVKRIPPKTNPQDMLTPIVKLKRLLRLPRIVAQGAVIIVLGVGLFAAFDALYNWTRLVTTYYVNQYNPDEWIGLTYLRSQHPNEFLSVLTQGWINHFGFVENLGRTTHGDATIFTNGLPSTIGPDWIMNSSPEYSVGANLNYIGWLKDNGYTPVLGAPPESYNKQPTAWYYADGVDYAFWVPRTTLISRDPNNGKALIRSETQPVTYFHRVDSVLVLPENYPPDSVMVINETAYPGWIVTVDGKEATIESVGGRLAVALPDRASGTGSTEVLFTYRPLPLFAGAAITVLTALMCIVFLLRADERIPVTVRDNVTATASRVASRAMYVLATPGLLGEDPDAPKELPAPETPLLLPSTTPLPNGQENGQNVAHEPEPVIPTEINGTDEPLN
ncbi:MAG: hypothetical protein ABI947_30130 [Chloroflexota bacterium]